MRFRIVLYGVLSIGMQETEENQIIFGRTKLTLCKLRALYRYNCYTHTPNYMSISRLIIYDVENNLNTCLNVKLKLLVGVPYIVAHEIFSQLVFFEVDRCNHQIVDNCL